MSKRYRHYGFETNRLKTSIRKFIDELASIYPEAMITEIRGHRTAGIVRGVPLRELAALIRQNFRARGSAMIWRVRGEAGSWQLREPGLRRTK